MVGAGPVEIDLQTWWRRILVEKCLRGFLTPQLSCRTHATVEPDDRKDRLAIPAGTECRCCRIPDEVLNGIDLRVIRIELCDDVAIVVLIGFAETVVVLEDQVSDRRGLRLPKLNPHVLEAHQGRRGIRNERSGLLRNNLL